MILTRFKDEKSEAKISDEEYFSAEEDLNRYVSRKKDRIQSENIKNKSEETKK